MAELPLLYTSLRLSFYRVALHLRSILATMMEFIWFTVYTVRKLLCNAKVDLEIF